MQHGKRVQGQYVLARQILAYVREGCYEREHHLVETALAGRFGVSRTLIRAALKRLQAEKVVCARYNQGFFLLKASDELEGKTIRIPPTIEEGLYRRLVRDRISGKIPESIIQVTLMKRYDVDRGALLRVLARMAEEGIVRKNKGHGWTFLPTINTDVSLRSSFDLRRTLEPNGILLPTFRIDPAALERMRVSHLFAFSRANTLSALSLFELDADFHETIASFTHNNFFLQVVQQHNRLRRLLEFRGYQNRKRVRSWLQEHISIIEALEANRPATASKLMAEHLDKAYRVAVRLRATTNGRNDDSN
jgi:DNA-binding GntR family transcriptional regulator